jgi:hypothetical protein
VHVQLGTYQKQAPIATDTVRMHVWENCSSDRCSNFLNNYAETNVKKLAFLTQKKPLHIVQKLNHNIVFFKKNANFFAENLQKIAEISDHNSGPLMVPSQLLKI